MLLLFIAVVGVLTLSLGEVRDGRSSGTGAVCVISVMSNYQRWRDTEIVWLEHGCRHCHSLPGARYISLWPRKQ